ncbi:MAG: S8 family serine peptidase [bacterium]|nr:S8 family serine peptidase [bacterium]
MKINLKGLVLLGILSFLMRVKAIDNYPKYVLSSVAFYNAQLISNPDFQFSGLYSSDSCYVKILNQYSLLLKEKSFGFQAIRPTQKINYQWQTSDSLQFINVATFDEQRLNVLALLYKNKLLYKRLSFLSLRLKVSRDDIKLLLADNGVKFISFLPPHVQVINWVERSNHRVSQFAPNFPTSAYLTGKGVSLAEWDGGDIGRHIDFDSRLTVVKKLGIDAHATHVGGTMAGAGNLDPEARGMAPEAKIYSWDFNGDIPIEMDTCQTKYGYVITQNSYGYWTNNCIDFALYDVTSTDMDRLSNKHTDLLHVFAAGNSRGMNCVSGGYKTILPGFQSAKNTMSVAAVNNTDGDSYFSCAGPTQDGRFKPEISAVGVNVYSTQDNNNYAGGWSGTSMATPGASGSIALLYERFKSKYSFFPPNFLAKNIISNAADDIGNIGPDYLFGFGRINGQTAVNLIDSGFWNIDSVANNGAYYDTLYLPSNLNELRVMLVWNDPEVNPSSSPILVNDLDLTITDSLGNVYQPWWCNPNIPTALAIRKRDTINNIEQVTIKNPNKGFYIVKVFGKKIPIGKQSFSITWLKEPKKLSITYPNGGESILSPSNAAKAQIIRWDNFGVSGNYKLEFSNDSGLSWQTIATNIPNAQRYYVWQTLADTISTGRALIRISNGTLSDMSDNVFSISNPITGLNTLACDSQLYLRWKSIPKTAYYTVYQMKNGKMQAVGTTTDTAFLVTQLNNNNLYWFSVSRRANNGAESMRCRAISGTPSNANFPPRITINPKDTSTCYSNVFYLKSKSNGTNPITSAWEFSKNNGATWNTIGNSLDSINCKLYVSDFSYWVRRSYKNICLAPVYSKVAVVKLDSNLIINFFNKDTTVCFASLIKDSINIISKVPAQITWYNDSSSTSTVLQKGLSNNFSTTIKKSMSIWAEVSNLCGTIKSKDISKPAKLNGRNEYSLFPIPSITSADTLMACVGETITLGPTLSGGRPGYQKLKIITEDSIYFQNNILRKITKNQVVKFAYFDNCYPDTITKSMFIKMYQPLGLTVLKDSTICFNTTASLQAKPTGGNGNYSYTWKDAGANVKVRNVTLQNTQYFYLTLTDNCTEKSVSDSVLITVLPPLSFVLRADNDTICNGTAVNLSMHPDGGRVGTRNIQWKNNQLSGTNPSIILTQSTWLPVTLSDACSPEITDSIFVFVREPLSIKIDRIDSLCNAKSVGLNAQIKGGLKNQSVVNWSPISKTGVSVSYLPLSTQYLKATVFDACSVPNASDSILIHVFDPLVLIMTNDTATCYGQALQLNAKYKGGKFNTQQFYWNNVKTNGLWVDSFKTATYRVVVKDACGDSISRNVLVNVGEKLALSPSVVKKCSYNDIAIAFNVNSIHPSTVIWDQLPAGKSQLFTNQTNAFYNAIISDGCSDTSHFIVPVYVSDFSKNTFIISKVVLKKAEVKLDKNSFDNFIDWGDGQLTKELDSIAVHAYNNYGKFTICKFQRDSIGCTDTICKTLINEDPLGFKNYLINLYPNPVTDLLYLDLNQLSGDLQLSITDATGKLIIENQKIYPPYEDYAINLSGIASGVYTLKLVVNGETMIAKFVKLEE